MQKQEKLISGDGNQRKRLPLLGEGDEYQLERDTKNFRKAGDNLYFDLGGDYTSVYRWKSKSRYFD